MSLFIHKRLKAFTLLELLVGMIISGIVVAACFNAYRIIGGQFKTYRETTAVYDSFSFFEAEMQREFSDAKDVERVSGNEIRMIYEDRDINWQFKEKYALRNDGNETDTFFVSVRKAEMFSDGEKEDGDVTVNQVKLILDINGHSLEADFKKE